MFRNKQERSLTVSVKASGKTVSTHADVELINPGGKGDIVLVCEHATPFIPPEYKGLGLNADALASHIAWDPGAMAVAKMLSAVFDVPLIAPGVSRLLFDCNRAFDEPSAIPARSEIYDIPGNTGLSDAARLDRAERFYRPYQDALVGTIEAAKAAGRSPAVITIHSFTPIFNGVRRDLDIGILHDADDRLANKILAVSGLDGDLNVQRNKPYGPEDGATHTLAEHGVKRGLLNVMIEVRNDLIVSEAAQRAMSNRLAGWLKATMTQ